MQQLGVSVAIKLQCAASGKDACVQLTKTIFDLVILDIDLPDVTGFDIAHWYLKRSNAEHARAPARHHVRSPSTLVALTALELNDAVKVELNQLFSEVLPKPLSIMMLRAVLQRWLPRALMESNRQGEPSAPGTMPSEPPRVVRILQVEDCEIAGMAIEHLFKSVGCWVETVHDGESAMEKLTHSYRGSHTEYDLVLVDVNLPTVSGYALSSWYADMCRQQALRRAPVIAVTAEPDLAACRAFGVDRCLPKPVTIEAVNELMLQWRALHCKG
uniref:Response regulatory domain-containing protein n=1 Tax=Calcidiscus leptoporus TaxID=127549 RepID=A0A7S0JJQ7_9EUKA